MKIKGSVSENSRISAVRIKGFWLKKTLYICNDGIRQKDCRANSKLSNTN